MKNNLTRIPAVLLVAVTLLGVLSGCNAAEPDATKPGSSIGSSENLSTNGTEPTTGSTDDTTATNPTTGTTDDAPAGNETISGTENTEPTTEPTEPTTEPSTPPTEPSDETEACVHNWSSWTTKVATCTAQGSKTRSCANCKKVEAEIISATGHSYGSWSTVKAATCDTDGVKTAICTKCGNSKTESLTATGHNWDKGTVTTTPVSCFDIGIKTYTCKVCSHTKTENINGNHSFGQWQWEEYEYTVDYGKDHPGYVPGFPTTATYPSRRKIRTCSNCGYQENDGTPDHYCARGSDDHKVTTVKEGVCGIRDILRSTCKVCGWYVEYEGKTGEHPQLIDKVIHLTDYTEYTNELDAIITTCTACDYEHLRYDCGKGWWDDGNKYYNEVSTAPGDGVLGNPIAYRDDTCFIDHPEWQMVRRNFKYDSKGYVKEYTQYWWHNGKQYSFVVDCTPEHLKSWFAEYGIIEEGNVTYHLKISGNKLVPYKISWTG